MNNRIKTNVLLAFILCAIIPLTSLAQDVKEAGKEAYKKHRKEIQLKTVTEKDGKKMVKDTVFTVDSFESAEDVMGEISWIDEDDSTKTILLDMMIDGDALDDGDHGMPKIIIKSKDGHHKVLRLKNGEGDEVDMDVLIDLVRDFYEQKAHCKEMKWQMEEMNDELRKKLQGLKELEHLEGIEQIEKIEALKELDELHSLKDHYFEYVHPPVPPKPLHKFYSDGEYLLYRDSNKVSDSELREAGIKNKTDRLEVNDFNIRINKGIVNLEFSMSAEGSPKVVVYNYFGDKVFSGKPENIGTVYTLTIDMSAKQPGKYYLQIVQKDSSFTEKFKL